MSRRFAAIATSFLRTAAMCPNAARRAVGPIEAVPKALEAVATCFVRVEGATTARDWPRATPPASDFAGGRRDVGLHVVVRCGGSLRCARAWLRLLAFRAPGAAARKEGLLSGVAPSGRFG